MAVIRKARTTDTPLFSGAGRKFLLSLLPALAVGAGLTWPLFVAGEARLLPAVWLLLYGTAVMAAGAFSVLSANISNDADGDGTIENMFVPDANPPTRITIQVTAQSPAVDPVSKDFIRYTVSSDVVLRKEL